MKLRFVVFRIDVLGREYLDNQNKLYFRFLMAVKYLVLISMFFCEGNCFDAARCILLSNRFLNLLRILNWKFRCLVF